MAAFAGYQRSPLCALKELSAASWPHRKRAHSPMCATPTRQSRAPDDTMSELQQPAVSVVVPVRNEADNIAPLVAEKRVGRKASGFKKFQSWIANAVRAAVLRDGTRDTGCGLKAFRRDLFLALPYFDGLHRFLPALVRREGYGIGYVDVLDRPRRFGTSNYGMWDRLWVGILDLFGVWWLIRRRRVPHVLEVKRNAD